MLYERLMGFHVCLLWDEKTIGGTEAFLLHCWSKNLLKLENMGKKYVRLRWVYGVWVRCSTRRVGIDLLEGPIAPGNPPFSSHLQPFLRLIPTDAFAPLPTSVVPLSFLFSFPPSTLSLCLPCSSPCFEASCVTLLMTLRKHAVSTSSKLPGHGYISWLTDQAHFHVNPSSKMREEEG